MQLMSQLVHKAEQDIDSLAAQLRGMSHPAGAQAAAALSASSPMPSGLGAVNDLIHAARSSVEQIAKQGDGALLALCQDFSGDWHGEWAYLEHIPCTSACACKGCKPQSTAIA